MNNMTYRPPSKKEKEQYWKNLKHKIISIITLLSILIGPVVVFGFLIYSLIYNPQLMSDIILPLLLTALIASCMVIVIYEPLESYYYMKKRKRNGYYAEFMNSTVRAIVATILVAIICLNDYIREKYLYWYLFGIIFVIAYNIMVYRELKKKKPPINHTTEELAEKRAQYIEQFVTDLKRRYTNIDVVTKEAVIRPIEKYDIRHVLLPHYYYLEYVLPYDKHAEYSNTNHILDRIHKDIQRHARADEWNKCLEYLEKEVGKLISISDVKNLLN